jgi:hypothetical protein
MRDRCRRLAATVPRGQNLQAANVVRLAEDVAVLADELNALLSHLENGSSGKPQGFRPFEPFT